MLSSVPLVYRLLCNFSRTTSSGLPCRIVEHQLYLVLGMFYIFWALTRESWADVDRCSPRVQCCSYARAPQVSNPSAFAGARSTFVSLWQSEGKQDKFRGVFFRSFLFGFWFFCNRIKYYLPALKLSLKMRSVGLPQTTGMRL